MKNMLIVLCVFGFGLGFVHADTVVGSYHALYTKDDLYSSKGKKLGDTASIIQQERANYYRFKKRSEYDTASSTEFFKSAANRAKIPAMAKLGGIKKNYISTSHGTGPYLKVTIMKNGEGKYYLKLTPLAG